MGSGKNQRRRRGKNEQKRQRRANHDCRRVHPDDLLLPDQGCQTDMTGSGCVGVYEFVEMRIGGHDVGQDKQQSEDNGQHRRHTISNR